MLFFFRAQQLCYLMLTSHLNAALTTPNTVLIAMYLSNPDLRDSSKSDFPRIADPDYSHPLQPVIAIVYLFVGIILTHPSKCCSHFSYLTVPDLKMHLQCLFGWCLCS